MSGGDRPVSGGLAALGVWGLLAAIVLQALPLPPQVPVFLGGAAAGLVLLAATGTQAPVCRRNRWIYAFGGVFLLGSLLSMLGAERVAPGLHRSLPLLPQLLIFQAVASRFDRTDRIRLEWALMAAGGLLAGLLLAVALKHPGQMPQFWLDWAKRPFFSVPNDLLFLVLVAPFVLAHLIESRQRSRQVLLLIVLGVLFTTLVVYRTRMGVLLFVFLCLWFGLARVQRIWRALAWSLVLVPALVILIDATRQFELLQKFSQISTLAARVPLWVSAWEMFVAAPWLGHGPGAFARLYPDYLSGIHFPDWVRASPVLAGQHAPWAHSLYLELLAERGLVGLLSFAGLMFVAGKRLLGGWRRACPRTQALGASLVLMGLGGLAEFSLLRYWFSQYLLLILAMIFVFNPLEESSHDVAIPSPRHAGKGRETGRHLRLSAHPPGFPSLGEPGRRGLQL